MSLKVSDEFTLPLCNTHHDSLHRTGDERAWWARHRTIDPLKIAARLWTASRLGDSGQGPESEENGESADVVEIAEHAESGVDVDVPAANRPDDQAPGNAGNAGAAR